MTVAGTVLPVANRRLLEAVLYKASHRPLAATAHMTLVANE
jgi:hypothetical protein